MLRYEADRVVDVHQKIFWKQMLKHWIGQDSADPMSIRIPPTKHTNGSHEAAFRKNSPPIVKVVHEDG